jgi:hypothetical protein
MDYPTRARSARAGWHARLGPDSLVALVVFALGVAGMFVQPH